MTNSFDRSQPHAWMFHRATSRWTFNSIGPAHDTMPSPGVEDPGLPWTPLPQPEAPAATLIEALGARRSCRSFAGGLTLPQLVALLGLGFGVKGRMEFGAHELLARPHPSGGGLYAVEVSLLARAVDGLEAGVYHYVPAAHGLETVRSVRLPHDLVSYLFMGQGWAAEAAVLFVFWANFERCMKKYGDRGYRYLLLEAGHGAQNLNLLAEALGLGSCNLGGFFDVELSDLLGLDHAGEAVLYAVAVGPPATG